MLTRRENLLIRPWQERRYIHHRRKVETALPAIDVRPPPQRQHVTCKLKKLQKEAERCERIHQDNFTLLQHLSSIMRTSRVDNYWVEAPPNFLHRVGIYHVKEHKEPERQEVEDVRNLHSRKEKCLGCNPQLLPAQLHIPEERVPWEAPKKRLSRRSSSFMDDSDVTDTKGSTQKSSNESLAKINTTPKSTTPSLTDLSRPSTGRTPTQPRFPAVETHSIVLKHGALRLSVNFPPQTTVKLRTGQTERLLQTEFCHCSRPLDKPTPAPVSE